MACRSASLWCPAVAKTLVIAEKPSVARDLADALPGLFQNKETHFESDDYVITFAVGHLLELIDPEEYDEKLQEVAHGRPADRPGRVPRCKPRDKKAEKQLKADLQAAAARRRRPGHQRLRRRARGRADLLVHLRDRPGGQAGRAALDLVDDEGRRSATASSACGPARSCARSRRPPARAPRPTGSSA